MPIQQELRQSETPSVATGYSSEVPLWFAVHTRSRYEKRVAAQLGEKQIDSFLPTMEEVHHWSDRRKVVEQPLFPGYVFVRISPEDQVRGSVLRTIGVVGFVGIQGRGLSIPDQEIENIQRLLSSEIPFGPYPFLRVGQKVRIRGGYLDGIEGILVAKNSDQSVVISVELIQRSLSIRVRGFDLEPIQGYSVSCGGQKQPNTGAHNSTSHSKEN